MGKLEGSLSTFVPKPLAFFVCELAIPRGLLDGIEPSGMLSSTFNVHRWKLINISQVENALLPGIIRLVLSNLSAKEVVRLPVDSPTRTDADIKIPKMRVCCLR